MYKPQANEDPGNLTGDEPNSDIEMETMSETDRRDGPIKRFHFSREFIAKMEKNGEKFEYDDLVGELGKGTTGVMSGTTLGKGSSVGGGRRPGRGRRPPSKKR